MYATDLDTTFFSMLYVPRRSASLLPFIQIGIKFIFATLYYYYSTADRCSMFVRTLLITWKS